MIRQALVWACIVILGCVPRIGFAADPPGLMTVASNNSVAETIQRFEDAINQKAGWFSRAWIMPLPLKSTNRSYCREPS